nr:RHS repeat-associated core domain-containing protein [uncultured Flavobacterium sp.]
MKSLDYFSYGKILREYDGGAGDRYLTTNHERDKETGLDYRGARYYDSDVARFLSLDPLAAKYPNLSAYNYVAGNPIVFIDPDGKDIKPTESFAGSPLNNTLNNLRANNSNFNKYFEKFSNNKSFNMTFDVNNSSVPSGSLAYTSYNYSWKTNAKGEKYTSAVESTISFRDDIYYNEIGQAVLISHEAIHAYAGLMRIGGDDTNHDKWDNYLSIMTEIVKEIASDNGLELNPTEIKELSLYNVGPGGKVYDEYVSALAKSNGTSVDDEIKALDIRMEKIITTPVGE